jgi:hypothetical protein
MIRRPLSVSLILAVVAALVVMIAPVAGATPVCTDGYMGGPPLSDCGGRVFPESEDSEEYVQYQPNPISGFREYQHGLEYLAQLYPRWVSVFTLSDHYSEEDAVSAGPDGTRSHETGDTGDGYEIFVVKLTDHDVADEGKQNLLYSLSIHGDEKGGIEGGVRAIEDLAMAAEDGGTIVDGVAGYESTTGRQPDFHEYEVADVLANQAVYLIDFNIDGWVRGDHTNIPPAIPPGLYTRGNYMGTDLNRQMPTVGRIAEARNPLEESEMLYGHQFMHEVADQGVNGQLAYGADVHGESQSRAWVDIMYPAGQFDSVKHRRLMAIAERTKSVIDDTLYMGLANDIEEATGGNQGEGIEDIGFPPNTVPTKPARWGTVWDTLGYTDTGFIGDYLAEELGVTGMDYEIALNHADAARPFGRPWTVLLQENYINATRAIIKTAMAYAMTQDQDFADFQIDPKGRVGYLFTPEVVTDADGVGTLPGPEADGIGENGLPVVQQPYEASQMTFFEEEGRLIAGGLNQVLPADIAADPKALHRFDSLVLADLLAPPDAQGRAYNEDDYLENIGSWVRRGGNLILVDRALHLLGRLGVVHPDTIRDIEVYQPYANFTNFEHPMLAGLRPNARQLSEATLIGYGIGNSASPMTIVDTDAWTAVGGEVVGTTAEGSGDAGDDDGSQTSVGQLEHGKGQIRILGGGLHTPTEENDHRYGLKDYSLTYSGLFVIENSIVHDAPGLGIDTTCAGFSDRLNHIVGTDADEVLRGTKGRDVICGSGGDDVVKGLGGNDVLLGGVGNDRLRGQRGDDTAIGGRGNDALGGGQGKDRLVGERGRDQLRGHGGNDTLIGNAGADRIGGAKGVDRVNGGRGKDRCRGGVGADQTRGCE